MTASLSDLLAKTYNSANPNVARVTSPRIIGGATLSCDNLAGWPDDTVVHFSTYRLDTDNSVMPGSQTDWIGIVSGNSIGSLTRITGASDGGHANNDVVEMNPTAKWANNLIIAILTHANQDGTLKADSVTSTAIAALAVTTAKLNGLAVTETKIADGAVTPSKWTNPYKFHVYRNAAWTAGNNVDAKVVFDTEAFDTNSNFDTTTGRYTIPVTGYYSLSATVGFATISGAGVEVWLHKNGSRYMRGNGGVPVGYTGGFGTSLTLPVDCAYFTAGDYLEICAYGANNTGNTGLAATYFMGHLVSTT